MIQYLLVLIDSDAPSFCYYPDGNVVHERMSLPVLRQTVKYAQKHNLRLNLLTNGTPLPQAYTNVLDAVTHIYFVQPLVSNVHKDDLTVFSDISKINSTTPIYTECVILRVHTNDLAYLPQTVRALSNKCRRINVHILDIDTWKKNDWDQYKTTLSALAKTCLSISYCPELNILTDRLELNEMHNCGAGDTHLTVSPDGQFYICPGFYKTDRSAGCGDVFRGHTIANAELYLLERAPICQMCDAWHCRRCIWMNKKLTREVNTPSREQCICTHLERNTTAIYLSDALHPTAYLDPFDILSKH